MATIHQHGNNVCFFRLQSFWIDIMLLHQPTLMFLIKHPASIFSVEGFESQLMPKSHQTATPWDRWIKKLSTNLNEIWTQFLQIQDRGSITHMGSKPRSLQSEQSQPQEPINRYRVRLTAHTWSVQKVSDLNFSRINKSSTGSVHHCTCGGDIYVHASIFFRL